MARTQVEFESFAETALVFHFYFFYEVQPSFIFSLGSICQQLLPRIKCPTLIIHGEKDPLVPRFHAEYIHEHIKGSR